VGRGASVDGGRGRDPNESQSRTGWAAEAKDAFDDSEPHELNRRSVIVTIPWRQFGPYRWPALSLKSS
jgi:hypothetical protein